MLNNYQHIDQGKALLRWHLQVEETNAKQPIVPHTRMIKGQPKVFHRQKKEISTSVKDTGSFLIRQYIKEFFKVRQASKFAGVIQLLDELPSLSLNAVSLGNQRSLSDRQARAHVSKLRKVGLISGYKFHGTRSNFEIWIDPQVLWQEAKTQAENAEKASFQQALSALAPSPQEKKFPLITSLETQATKEIDITDVNKGALPGPEALPGGEGTRNTGNTTGNRGAHQTGSAALTPENSPAERKKLETGALGGAAPKKAVKPEYLAYVENFWNYAWKVLYPQISFTEHEQKQAKNAIYRSVYYGFRANLTPQQWQEAHDFLLQRLDLAATYYQRNPNKYAPMPFAEFVHGTGYFDYENSRGFKATEDWLVKHLARKHQLRIEDALRQARNDFSQHKRGTIRKRMAEKSPLELFRYHENKFKTLGKPALERFYAQFAKKHQPEVRK